jgi:methionine biosynthesis protein MetW
MTPDELLRADQRLITQLVPEGARVLDLGCGDGTLLARLRDERGAIVRGVEIELDDIARCIEKDVPVYQGDLDEGLADIPDGRFDVVILSQTLQVVKRPKLVLSEMLRVGKRGVVSFPNFAHWKLRAHLLLHGRMPVSEAIPYTWYDTPNIHHTTITDFRDFCTANGAVVEREICYVGRADGRARISHRWPNLFADEAVFVLRRAERSAPETE